MQPLKELESHVLHCMSWSLIAKKITSIILCHFSVKKRVTGGGLCVGVYGYPSVLSNKSVDELKNCKTERPVTE